jgi:hypothetical protein
MRTLLRFSTEPPNQVRGIFKYPVQSWFAGSLEPKCAQVRVVRIFPGPLPNEESSWSPLVCDPPAPAPHITHNAPMQDPTAIGPWVERIQAGGKRVWVRLNAAHGASMPHGPGTATPNSSSATWPRRTT